MTYDVFVGKERDVLHENLDRNVDLIFENVTQAYKDAGMSPDDRCFLSAMMFAAIEVVIYHDPKLLATAISRKHPNIKFTVS